MSRKQTRRKHWGLVNPLAHVLDGITETPKNLLDKLRTRELSALESMAKGTATIQDWRDLTDMLNIAETMALSGIGPEALPVCEQVQDALQDAAQRFEATGRMGMPGLGLQALRDMYEYADLQRSSISRGEYERMIEKTVNRVRNAKNHGRDVVMV